MNISADSELPALARWMQENELDRFEAAARIGCSHEYVRRMCLPLDNPRRCVPTRRMRGKIERATAGAVGVADWVAL